MKTYIIYKRTYANGKVTYVLKSTQEYFIGEEVEYESDDLRYVRDRKTALEGLEIVSETRTDY